MPVALIHPNENRTKIPEVLLWYVLKSEVAKKARESIIKDCNISESTFYNKVRNPALITETEYPIFEKYLKPANG